MKNKMKNKRGAIELSMSTIVIIVLSVMILIAAIYFIQKIFVIATNSIDSIDNQVQSELQKIFSGDETAKAAFYPTSRDVIVKKGDTPRGFAFQIRNNDNEDASFSFEVTATDTSKCGSFTEAEADDLLLGGSGDIEIGRGDISTARIVKFVIPEDAPKCTIGYDLKIRKGSSPYEMINFFLIIK